MSHQFAIEEFTCQGGTMGITTSNLFHHLAQQPRYDCWLGDISLLTRSQSQLPTCTQTKWIGGISGLHLIFSIAFAWQTIHPDILQYRAVVLNWPKKVDVGTGSVRAAVWDHLGQLLSVSTHPLKIWNVETDFYEQSSDDIWQAVCTSVKEALATSNVSAQNIKGIGFDATCSLWVILINFNLKSCSGS